jgi:CBS domain-containing protein
MREYVDFLGGQSPYDALDSADLADLAHLVEVEYFTAGSTIVTAGEPPLSSLTVAR